MKKATIALMLPLIATLWLVGCGPTYGSPTTTFNVSVTPTPGIVYMIPEKVWIKNKKRDMLNNKEKMEVWRQGKSPVDVETKVGLPYVFVVYQNGQYSPAIIRKMSSEDKQLELNY